MGKKEFSLYEIEQFIREAGAEKVTEDAVRDLEMEMERLVAIITKKAIAYAEHAGRKKLIRTSDILLTTKPEYHDYSSPENLSASPKITKSASNTVR